MRNAGDAFPLQKGRLAHQRPGGKKEHPPPAPFHQPRQNMRCQHCSTAPGPAAARLHVLGGNIIQQASAVLVVLHRTISFVHQLMQQGAANFTQITGKNGVKVLRGGAGARKVVQQRLGRRGGHRGPHVVDILDPCITHPPNGS